MKKEVILTAVISVVATAFFFLVHQPENKHCHYQATAEGVRILDTDTGELFQLQTVREPTTGLTLQMWHLVASKPTNEN